MRSSICQLSFSTVFVRTTCFAHLRIDGVEIHIQLLNDWIRYLNGRHRFWVLFHFTSDSRESTDMLFTFEKKNSVFFSSALVDVECYVMHHGLPWIQNRRRKLCFHVFMILHVQFLYICARNSLLAFARMHMCERLRERAKWHLEMYHQILWWVYYYWHYCYNCCLLCIPFYIFIFILYSYTIFSSFSLALRQAPSVALTRVLSHLCKSNGLKTV